MEKFNTSISESCLPEQNIFRQHSDRAPTQTRIIPIEESGKSDARRMSLALFDDEVGVSVTLANNLHAIHREARGRETF